MSWPMLSNSTRIIRRLPIISFDDIEASVHCQASQVRIVKECLACWRLASVSVTGSTDGLHGAASGAQLATQRADHDVNDVTRRRVSVSPNRFHEIVTTDGLSWMFLQVTHHSEFK